MTKYDYEKLLDEFVSEERAKQAMGSGDNGFYMQQVTDYVNKQRPFWITAIKRFMKMGREESKKERERKYGESITQTKKN